MDPHKAHFDEILVEDGQINVDGWEINFLKVALRFDVACDQAFKSWDFVVSASGEAG